MPATASAPAAPAAPSAPTPAPASVPSGGVTLPPAGPAPIEDDPFTAYDKMPDKPADLPADRQAGKPPETPKPADKKTDAKPDAKPDTKPPEDKKPDVKPGDKKPDEAGKERKTGWQRFREAEKNLSDFKAEQTKIRTDLEKRVAEAEARLGKGDFKIDDHPEYKKLSEMSAAEKKRAQDLEQKLGQLDYEQSPEYKEKYHQPYVDTCKAAVASVAQLNVVEGDGTRQATADDLWKIVTISNPETALTKAEELFGSASKAAYVMAQRDKILESYQRGEIAKQQHKGNASELNRQKEMESAKQAEEAAGKFSKLNAEAEEKYPHWFKAVDGDDEGNTLLERGRMLADAAFGGQIKDEKTGVMRDPTADEIVIINSSLRNKAAGFDRLVRNTKQLEAKIAELEDELKDYRETAPGEGEKAGDTGKGEEDPFARFDKK